MGQKNNLKTPRVAILMGTFNGEAFLAEQLESLATQTFKNTRLFISDDGSSDGTLELISHYQKSWGEERIQVRSGPQQGFCKNFLSLASDPSIQADYYAFSDQDDVWFSTKLECAIKVLENHPNDLPVVYCGRTQYLDEQGKPLGLSPDFVRPMTFRNALLQSVAGANTMVFNQAAKVLFEQFGLVEVPSHDWWAYLIVTGAGGHLYFDHIPQIYYRQHPGALVGENVSILSKLKRAWMLFNGLFRGYIDLNLSALYQAPYLLTPVCQEDLAFFRTLRQAGLLRRIQLIWDCRLYRQSRLDTYIMRAAAVLRKI